jgi:hypothetical protein
MRQAVAIGSGQHQAGEQERVAAGVASVEQEPHDRISEISVVRLTSPAGATTIARRRADCV